MFSGVQCKVQVEESGGGLVQVGGGGGEGSDTVLCGLCIHLQ